MKINIITISIIVLIILMLGFVSDLRATTFICATPDISTTPPHCPGICTKTCGGPRDIPFCQISECESERCTIQWYGICLCTWR